MEYKRYKDLDLRHIMEVCNLDFAHYTYQQKQCSCCYGPEDAPAKYWRGGIIKQEDYTYILFDNAANGSGPVRGTWPMKKLEFVRYCLPDIKTVEKVCIELKKQLGEDYYVLCPKDMILTIIIVPKIYYSCLWSNNYAIENNGAEYVLEKVENGYKIIK